MKERSTLPRSSKGTKRKHESDESRNISANERAMTQTEVDKSEHAHAGDNFIGRKQTSCRGEPPWCEGAEHRSKTHQNGSRNTEDAPQLQRWAYEVSDANITLTEKLEKSRWEAERS